MVKGNFKLSRTTPERTYTEVYTWCVPKFLPMSPKYREIRRKHRNPMDKCHWCKYPFKDGDMMALVSQKRGTNKVLCQTCAKELLDSNEPVKNKPKGYYRSVDRGLGWLGIYESEFVENKEK